MIEKKSLFKFARCIAAEVAGLIGAIGSAAINAASQAHTNAQNRRQADYAFRQQQNAIREQNAYNSPGEQVVRMMAAGLNPSLAYGADGAMVGNQSEVPAYTPIPAEAPNIGNLGAGVAEAVRTGIDVRDFQRRQDLAAAEIAAKNAESFLAMSAGVLNQAQTKETLALLGYKQENYESLTQLNWEKVLSTRKEMSVMDEQMKKMRSEIRLNDAQIKELAARERLSESEVISILARLPHEIALMDANAAFAAMQMNESREKIVNLAAERYHMAFIRDVENRKLDWDKDKTTINGLIAEYQIKADALNHLQDNIARIISLGVGASALRSGQPLPPATAPGSSPSSGYEYGTFGTYGD